jgi:hypothetical protein
MKRNYLVLSVLIFFSMSCDFRGENLDQQDLKKPSLEILHEIDLKNIGEYHNILLEKIVEDERMNYNASLFRKNDVRTSLDSLDFIKKIQSFILNNNLNTSLTLYGEKLNHSNFNFTDEQLMQIFRGLKSQEISGSELVPNPKALEWYFNSEIALNSLNQSQFESKIKGLEVMARSQLSDSPETLNVVLMGLYVGKYSNGFWNFSNHTSTFQIQLNGRSSGWITTGIADIQGAYSWGCWGSIAGPAGAVILGANGALLHSGTAYLADKYLP